jgi:hypothetical protein
MLGDEVLGQRCFPGTRLGSDRDDPPPAFARKSECISQSPQLFIALEQVDGCTPFLVSVCPHPL